MMLHFPPEVDQVLAVGTNFLFLLRSTWCSSRRSLWTTGPSNTAHSRFHDCTLLRAARLSDSHRTRIPHPCVVAAQHILHTRPPDAHLTRASGTACFFWGTGNLFLLVCLCMRRARDSLPLFATRNQPLLRLKFINQRVQDRLAPVIWRAVTTQTP